MAIGKREGRASSKLKTVNAPKRRSIKAKRPATSGKVKKAAGATQRMARKPKL
jgi:hypothetical protein